MLVCVSVCYPCTRDRGCSAHPVFPAPSLEGRPAPSLEGRMMLAQLGRIARRESEVMSVFGRLKRVRLARKLLEPVSALQQRTSFPRPAMTSVIASTPQDIAAMQITDAQVHL